MDFFGSFWGHSPNGGATGNRLGAAALAPIIGREGAYGIVD